MFLPNKYAQFDNQIQPFDCRTFCLFFSLSLSVSFHSVTLMLILYSFLYAVLFRLFSIDWSLQFALRNFRILFACSFVLLVCLFVYGLFNMWSISICLLHWIKLRRWSLFEIYIFHWNWPTSDMNTNFIHNGIPFVNITHTHTHSFFFSLSLWW